MPELHPCACLLLAGANAFMTCGNAGAASWRFAGGCVALLFVLLRLLAARVLILVGTCKTLESLVSCMRDLRPSVLLGAHEMR
jgi:hypothetical protein